MSENIKKIRIQRVNYWNMLVAVVMAVLFGTLSVLTWKQFVHLRFVTEKFIQCETASHDMQNASDYLTDRARMFVETGKADYMEDYFTEANVTKRREQALLELESYIGDGESYHKLKESMQNSVALMQTEYKAMRLRLEADAVPEQEWPAEIREVILTHEELTISQVEKRAYARNLVYGTRYQSFKDAINEAVKACLESLLSNTLNEEAHATTVFKDMLIKLIACAAVMFVLVFISFYLIRRLIVKPIVEYNKTMQEGKIYPISGAAELQQLANTYNYIYDENQRVHKLIRHEADNDALTDTLNRGSFDRLLKIYNGSDSKIALIICDIDSFKTVNDTYGHAVGDEAIKRVAQLLKKTFRSMDYVCRLGGDEFAVIMLEVSGKYRGLIDEKISYINSCLKNPDGVVPKLSISAGVAFADRSNPTDSIFKDADKALYYSKEHGKCSCSFYPVDDESEADSHTKND